MKSNHLILLCEKIAGMGWPISSVHCRQLNSVLCEICISIPDYGDRQSESSPGVGCTVCVRHPEDISHEIADEREIKSAIAALARYGGAQDWACFDYGFGKKAFLTKPQAWFPMKI